MRWLIALTSLTLLGCPGSNVPVSGSNPVDQNGCPYSCAMPCRGEGLCIPWPFKPSCVPPCASSDDCAGSSCVLLTTSGLPSMTTGVCVAGLKICGPDRACTPLTPMCRDANTLMKPLTATKNICGYELINCANGCDSTNNKCN